VEEDPSGPPAYFESLTQYQLNQSSGTSPSNRNTSPSNRNIGPAGLPGRPARKALDAPVLRWYTRRTGAPAQVGQGARRKKGLGRLISYPIATDRRHDILEAPMTHMAPSLPPLDVTRAAQRAGGR